MEVKPFTNYECSTGNVGVGHGSLYTRERSTSPSNGCPCGAPWAEVVPDGFRYKVVFESIDPFQASAMVDRYGKGIWKTLTDDQWEELRWMAPTASESGTPNVLKEQYRNLLAWAETHEQPIRNVRFYKADKCNWEEVVL